MSFDSYIGTSLHILAAGEVNIGFVGILGPENGIIGIDALAENIPLSDGTQVFIDGTARPTLDVRAGVDPNQIGIISLTGIDIFSDLFNGLPLLGQPTLSASSTSGDINIDAVAFLGRNAANGLVLLTNQYRPNRRLPAGDIQVGTIVATDNIAEVFGDIA